MLLRRKRCLVVALILTFVAVFAHAAPPNKLSVPIITTADIKPEMKGYGLTTFRGTKPEKFEVEVIDVLLNALPKHDMILIRCSHPIIEKSGIISGMSGSPIYIEGKLAGALAYGWSFSKEPIAGVTPIEWMMQEMKEPPKRKSAGSRAGAALNEKQPETSPASAPKGLTALRLPVYLSGLAGLPTGASSKIRKELDKRGLMLLEGTSGSKAALNIGADALVPGAPLGASLMRGDIDFTGIGTVTYREDDRLIAFGHPMMMSGEELSMPITTAYVHGVMPNQWMSFKFSSPSKSVGTLTQDKLPAIAGTLGRDCPMIKVHGKVFNLTNNRTETINVEIIQSRSWSPMLLWYASAYLLLLEGVADTSFAVNYTLDMDFEKHGNLHLEGMDMAWGGYSVSEPGYALRRLMDNHFEPLNPTQVSFEFKTVHKRIDARIQRAWLDQLEIQPGKEATLHLRIHPYDSSPQEISFPIRIPPHLDEGKYDIVVAGGSSWAVEQPTPPAESVKDIFTQLKMRYSPTTIVAVLKLPSVGVGFKGQLFRQLPSSVFGTLVSSSSAGVSTFQDGIHFTHQSKWYLTGDSQRLKIIVRQSAEEQE